MKAQIDRLYRMAKDDGKQRLGGDRAYWIHGPSIRRLAVADAILTTLALQDDAGVKDSTVRALLSGLFDRLTSDTDFQA